MIRRINTVSVTLALWLLCVPSPVAGQAISAPRSSPSQTLAATAPPAPIPPATVSRSADGAVTVRAVRISEPIKLDGRLDEEVYRTLPAISDFIQQEPWEGEPATEKTEAWVLFDNDNIYVVARCWDSQPEREVANEMRRDSQGILQNEAFSVYFDTFLDRRNGFNFSISMLGGMFDAAVIDERNYRDWNTVWDARVGRFESGWTVEIAFPFKSLRYAAGREQIWGFNLRRILRWKNEVSHLTRIPAFLRLGGFFAGSLAGTLVGLEVPPQGLNLDLKPFAIGGLRTDLSSQPQRRNARDTSAGFDVKWGITSHLPC